MKKMLRYLVVIVGLLGFQADLMTSADASNMSWREYISSYLPNWSWNYGQDSQNQVVTDDGLDLDEDDGFDSEVEESGEQSVNQAVPMEVAEAMDKLTPAEQQEVIKEAVQEAVREEVAEEAVREAVAEEVIRGIVTKDVIVQKLKDIIPVVGGDRYLPSFVYDALTILRTNGSLSKVAQLMDQAVDYINDRIKYKHSVNVIGNVDDVVAQLQAISDVVSQLE